MMQQNISPGALAMMRQLMQQRQQQPQPLMAASQNMMQQPQQEDRPLTNMGNQLGGAALMGLNKADQNADAFNRTLMDQAQGPVMPDQMAGKGWGNMFANLGRTR